MLPADTEGLRPSTVELPAGHWPCALDFLCERFPRIGRDTWIARMQRGRVWWEGGAPATPDCAFRTGRHLHYLREVQDETPIPFRAEVLHCDEHLLIADKPHFLPVMPAGRYVNETLLVRLRASTRLEHLAPLHRIDRETAGLVMFSVDPSTRGLYQQLFAQRRIDKTYEALAPPLESLGFPLRYRSRVVTSSDIFRMQEVPGEPNSETLIDVMESAGEVWRYRLQPVTGRKHQLRVHMAALGAPILHDRLYPQREAEREGDYSRPLQLLAQQLAFEDPVSGASREFRSRLRLRASWMETEGHPGCSASQ